MFAYWFSKVANSNTSLFFILIQHGIIEGSFIPSCLNALIVFNVGCHSGFKEIEVILPSPKGFFIVDFAVETL